MTSRRALWLLYAAFIVYGGTIPFHFAGHVPAYRDHLRDVSLHPFTSPVSEWLSIPDVVQNILLFVPFGALGMLAGRSGREARRFAGVTILALALSVMVEALQLLTADRIASLIDVASNTAGAIAGAAALLVFRGAASAGVGRLRAAGLADSAALRPLALAAGAILIAYWQPFDVTLDVSTTAAKVRALQSDVWQFSGLRDEGTSIILSVFFSTTLASYLSVIGERHAALKAALLGSATICALEASQLVIGSRVPGLWDAAIGVTGIGVGSVIWAASTRILWPALWLGVIVVATGAAAALQMLSPFKLAAEYHSMGWFPFLGYYGHTTFETLSHVIELVLLYLPLGAFVGQTAASNRRAAGIAIGITFAIAAPVEYLQGWVVGRFPDVTDIAVSLCGGLLGAWAGGLTGLRDKGRDA